MACFKKKEKIVQKNIGRDAIIAENIILNFSNEEDRQKIGKLGLEINKRNLKVNALLHEQSKVKKEIKAWSDSDGIFQLVENVEQAKDNVNILTFNQRQKDLLEETHQGALMNAVKILCKEDIIDKMNGHSEEFIESFQALCTEREIYENCKNGDLFKKIYNLLRSFDIRENVIPQIKESYTENNGDFSKVKPNFQKYWNGRLAKHPTMVWITSHFDFEQQDIESELIDRLAIKKPKVFLFSRGKIANIYAITLVEKIKKDYGDEYKVSVQKRSIAKIKCLCHVFTLIKIQNKAFFKIETCLTGPQTIEKAKQSAFVALDIKQSFIY